MKIAPPVRSIMLINTNLSTDCYSALPIMHSDVTATRFKGDNGYLSLFNIYNEITNNNTLKLLDTFYNANGQIICPTATDSIVWLGDFNCHHPMWEDDSNEHLYKPDDFIALLIHLLYKHDMLLALPKGIPTLQASTGNRTRPNNVWCCNTADDPVL